MLQTIDTEGSIRLTFFNTCLPPERSLSLAAAINTRVTNPKLQY
jgi:hypothetical protein